MARNARRPKVLSGRVFTTEEARQVGLERWHLEGASWSRLGPSLYVAKDLATSPVHRLEAARLRLPKTAAFSGLTAAWLHGLDVQPCDPIEATVPEGSGVSGRSGIALRRSELGKGDVVNIRAFRATSARRTVAEVCARLELIEAVAIADAATHRGLLKISELDSWAAAHTGYRGMENLRRVIGLIDPATESPMETRLRMVLIIGGLPRPKSQVTIRDRWGRALGRPDLYYDDARLGIEYDGGTHRETLADDNRRQNRLLNAGVRLLRFTAGDVLHHPESIVRQVRAMLAEPASDSSSAGARGFHDADLSASAGARG